MKLCLLWIFSFTLLGDLAFQEKFIGVFQKKCDAIFENILRCVAAKYLIVYRTRYCMRRRFFNHSM